MKKLLLTAALILSAGAANAAATTVVTETKLIHKPVPDLNIVDYRVFDANHDGALSMEEVGEKLFYTFDRDGNQLIDNIEFGHPMVLTFAPMERQTVQFVDYNNDGSIDKTVTTEQDFLQATGLTRFDKHADGLSAADFIERPFKKTDRDGSGQIDVTEWKQAYIAAMRPLPVNDSFRYNK